MMLKHNGRQSCANPITTTDAVASPSATTSSTSTTTAVASELVNKNIDKVIDNSHPCCSNNDKSIHRFDLMDKGPIVDPYYKTYSNAIASRNSSIKATNLLTSNNTGYQQKQHHYHEHDAQTHQDQNYTQQHHIPSNSKIGHYELKKTLGKGNFSTVKLAQHAITKHSVAIKIVKFCLLSDDNLSKIQREIEILKKIGKHKHIVRLYQVIKTKRYYFLVTEHCTDGELYDYLVDKGRLSEPQSCKYFQQILSAIEYLHNRNVVHRDLKAENLLLTENYETVKIADFGFANYFKQDNLLSTWCGSPPYAAPELFKGLHYVGPPVDIWSMGVILYVLNCGSLPFDGHNLVQLKSRVLSGKFRIPYFMSTECETLIRGMLRLEPAKRYNISRIKNHCWIRKGGNPRQKTPPIETKQSTVKQNQELSSPKEETTEDIADVSSVRLDAENNDANIYEHMNASKTATASSTGRGQSLDLEDGKGRQQLLSRPDTNEDSSMLCLTSGYDKELKVTDAPENDQSNSAKLDASKMKNFVDLDIANAVSYMSIDSNNSAMSVSHGIETANQSSNYSTGLSSICSAHYSASPRADSSCTSNTRQFSKESSDDDQIIEFMVENLKIADNQNQVRQSISNDKYDDLHAIYRLIKDQPDILNEAKFKIPSLPLISPNKDNRKPSITTGFFKSHIQANSVVDKTDVVDLTNNKSNSGLDARDEPNTTNFDAKISDQKEETNSGNSNTANVVLNLKSDHGPSDKLTDKQENLINQLWRMPPQLFLTPPMEAKVSQIYNHLSIDPSKSIEHQSHYQQTELNFQNSRRSFDSNASHCSTMVPKLASCQENFEWNCSLPDSNGASMMQMIGPHIDQQLSSSLLSRHSGNESQGTIQLAQDIAKITTNLPQIGDQQGITDAVSHNLFLAHLNSPNCVAAMTQSGLVSQGEPIDHQKNQTAIPIKFTPNNLINQNYNVMAVQNTLKIPGIPTLGLLDPDGLNSGLERRASDGQANYNSLTNDNLQANDDHNQLKSGSENAAYSGSCTTASMASEIRIGKDRYQQAADVENQKIHTGAHNSDYLSNTTKVDHNNQHHPCQFRDSSKDPVVGMVYPIQHHYNVLESRLNANDCQQASNIPLDLSNRNSNRADHNSGSQGKREIFSRTSQRANSIQQDFSTTSELANPLHISPHSATTSPRNSFLISSAPYDNGIPFCQVSPSSLSLTGGGPGHLLNRRKRHPFDTDSKQNYHQQQSLYHNITKTSTNNQKVPNFFIMKDESLRSLRQASKHLHYPTNSHLGQLRNFAQTFTYKKLLKRQASQTTNWNNNPNTNDTGNNEQTSEVTMDANQSSPLTSGVTDSNPI